MTPVGGQVMYVAMLYFVFMEAMVPCLIQGENILFLEPMLFTPFYRLVGRGKDGPCVSKLCEEPNEAIVFYMLLFVFCHTHNGPH